MSLPLWSIIERYAQCDPAREPPPALGVGVRYGAIGISWFLGPDALRDFRSVEGVEAMRRDEAEVFAALVRQTPIARSPGRIAAPRPRSSAAPRELMLFDRSTDD